MTVAECGACRLSRPVQVPHSGPVDAEVVFLGEAPGESEEATQQPFVGKAGQKWRALSHRASLDLASALTVNCCRCRPPENRTPLHDEVAACWGWHVLPLLNSHPRKLIVPLGNCALQALAGKEVPITSASGKLYLCGPEAPVAFVEGKPQVFPLVHPASLLYHPAGESDYLSNLRMLRRFIAAGYATLEYEVDVRVVRTVEEARGMFEVLRASSLVSLDTETGGFQWQTDPLVMYSFACRRGEGWVLPILWKDDWREPVAPPAWRPSEWVEVYGMLWGFLEDPDVAKAMHNGKFDSKFLWFQHGIRLRGFRFDTMLAHHLCDENASHGLKALARAEYGAADYEKPLRDEWEAAVKHHKLARASTGYDVVSGPTLANYAAIDAELTWRLAHSLERTMEKEEVRPLFDGWSMPVQRALQVLEQNGIAPNEWAVNAAVEGLGAVQAEAQQKLRELLGREVSPTNKNEHRRIFYEELGMPILARTGKAGGASVDRDTCALLREPSEEVWVGRECLRFSAKEVARWRQAVPAMDNIRLLSRCHDWRVKYVEKMLALRSAYDGRVHPNFNMAADDERWGGMKGEGGSGTVTGRLSCTAPNLQQQPPGLRALFYARPGRHFFASDFSQGEVRILAACSGDGNLRRVCERGDVHREIASLMYRKPPEAVTGAERTSAKGVTFGIMYGDVAVPEIMSMFYREFADAVAWSDDQVRFAHRHGHVCSMFGRKRRITGINDGNKAVRRHAENQARNSPIQEALSTITLAALVKLVNASERLGWLDMVLTIHDENLGEFDVGREGELREVVAECMTDPLGNIGVEMPFDLKTWPAWEGELDVDSVRERLYER